MGAIQHLAPVVTRVQHIGKCGVHTGTEDVKDCVVRSYTPFPADATATAAAGKKGGQGGASSRRWSIISRAPAKGERAGTRNGGWGDLRDIEMCNRFAKLRALSDKTAFASLHGHGGRRRLMRHALKSDDSETNPEEAAHSASARGGSNGSPSGISFPTDCAIRQELWKVHQDQDPFLAGCCVDS